jgi:hypothetical protein
VPAKKAIFKFELSPKIMLKIRTFTAPVDRYSRVVTKTWKGVFTLRNTIGDTNFRVKERAKTYPVILAQVGCIPKPTETFRVTRSITTATSPKIMKRMRG